MGDVSVLIPWNWGEDCGDRVRALDWVIGRYGPLLLEDPAAIVVSGPLQGEWSKAMAIRAELARCREIVVVGDADSWSEGVPAAVQAVRDGAPWAVPHRLVHRLTPIATAEVLRGCRQPAALPTEKRPYRGHAGGGIVVARRETLEAVPPDPRFVGWGSEDCAWRDALRTLVGMEWRESREPLIHLWHPPQLDARGRRKTCDANAELARRYIAARESPAAMRRLVDGG